MNDWHAAAEAYIERALAAHAELGEPSSIPGDVYDAAVVDAAKAFGELCAVRRQRELCKSVEGKGL